MTWQRVVAVGMVVATGAALGLGGCKHRDTKTTREQRMFQRSGDVPEAGIRASAPVHVEVVRSGEEDGMLGVHLKISNDADKRLLSANVVCTATDIGGQTLGTLTNQGVPPKGLGKGESVELHWFVAVKDPKAVINVTARLEQVKTE